MKDYLKNRPKKHYTYNDIFKKANLIIQIISAISMLLATVGFMFGIVGITLGVVVNTTNIKLNTISGISLIIISSYVFLMCAISLCLSVISSYHKTAIYLEILAIFAIASIVCMLGGFLIIFSNKKIDTREEQIENKQQINENLDKEQKLDNKSNINQSDDKKELMIENNNSVFNNTSSDKQDESKRVEKLQQVKRTYQLVKENKLSEEKLQTIFNVDPEFKQMYDDLKNQIHY
ncbi:YIP1 family protein [Mycoplasma capricolum]|uniref:YIP1 family protein n=1 Tax=Mycoplasma capricolum TaxID=2095 RepID=UPI0022F381F1|nr:YIP1 family protein [Mycoplasma capricolum]WBX36350.1 YIP1 family protein [Mycoplasma capricolum subsp. capricolum]